MASSNKDWWLDSDTVVLYHGTHIKNLGSIRERGINAPGWLTPSYATAKGYCIFCIEGDRASLARRKFQLPQPQDMIVISASVPRDYVLQYGIYDHPPGRLSTAWNLHKKRLADRTMFDSFTGTAAEYYSWTECRFDAGLPADFIGGHVYPYIGN